MRALNGEGGKSVVKEKLNLKVWVRLDKNFYLPFKKSILVDMKETFYGQPSDF
jgi:hypothetical protein